MYTLALPARLRPEAPKFSMMVLSKPWTVLAINSRPSFYLSNLASISIFIAKLLIPSNGWIELLRNLRKTREELDRVPAALCLLTASMRSCVGSFHLLSI